MKRILLAVNIGVDGMWMDIHNRDNMAGRNIDTVEKALQVLDLIYKTDLEIQSYETSATEIYAICQRDVQPCANCQNNL